MTDTAQLFTGVHDTPVYTNVLFDKPLRIWVAVPAVVGTVTTILLTVLNLSSGHALAILIAGALGTATLTGLGALVPRTRPSLAFRLKALGATVRPTVQTSTDTAILARPQLVDNLWFEPRRDIDCRPILNAPLLCTHVGYVGLENFEKLRAPALLDRHRCNHMNHLLTPFIVGKP